MPAVDGILALQLPRPMPRPRAVAPLEGSARAAVLPQCSREGAPHRRGHLAHAGEEPRLVADDDGGTDEREGRTEGTAGMVAKSEREGLDGDAAAVLAAGGEGHGAAGSITLVAPSGASRRG